MDNIRIVENKNYTLYYNPAKNRIYLKIIGFWRSSEIVPDYIKDWSKALSHANKGFTLLTDASEMAMHPKEVGQLHEKAQQLVLKAGVKKVAEVISGAFTELQLNNVAATTKFPKKNFKNIKEAEAWLDTIE